MSLLEDYYFLGRPSLEDLNTPAPTKEIEYEIYGRIKDLGELDKAPRKELQEQWGLFVAKTEKNFATGNVRVRSINDETYVLTTKVKLAEGSEEEEVPTTATMFQHFKKYADSGMRKMRFFFPVEGTDFIYEVDAFYNNVGQFVPWVKIDLELPNGMEGIDELPDLPFEMEEIRVIPPGKKNEEDLAFVRQLFDAHFNLPNSFIDPHAPSMEDCNLFTPDIEKKLRDIAQQMEDVKSALSYDGEGIEGTVKHQFLELSSLITNFYEGRSTGSAEMRAKAQAGEYTPYD